MNDVGTNTGIVHRQREGTGLAHILTGGSEALDTYGRIWNVSQAERARRDAAAEAKRAAALKGLRDFAPEYAYQHKLELQPLIEQHIQKGAELMANGVDPFVGTDEQSVMFQKEHQRIQALAQSSMQFQKEDAALMNDLEKIDPSSVTADSFAQALAWRNQPLSALLENGTARPPLLKKRAWSDASEFIGKNMKLWESGHEGAAAPEVEDFVINLLLQPANRDKIEAYAQKFQELPEPEKKRVQAAAQQGHREVVHQLALEDALRYQKGKEPFDFQKEIDRAASDATSRVSYSEWQQGERSGRAPKKGDVDRQAALAAEEMINSRPDWMYFFDRNGELPRGQEETDPSYHARVKALLTAKVKPRIKADVEYRVNSKGAEDQKKKESADLFVADITGDDLRAANSAANMLTNTTLVSNMKIEDASVNRAPDYSTALRLSLTTPMSVSQIKQSIVDEAGVASEDVEVVEREGKKVAIVSFRPGEGGKQSAARLYDNFMKETGSVYEPKHTERSSPTLDKQGPSKEPQAGQAPVNLDSFFK